MKEKNNDLIEFGEKELLEIKQIALQLKIEMQECYRIVIEEVSLICEDVRDKIYLSQNNFECMLDILLSFAMHVDVKKEFNDLINAYLKIYPDSVENYIRYYNESCNSNLIEE